MEKPRFDVIPIDGTCVMAHAMMSDLLYRYETLCKYTSPPLSLTQSLCWEQRVF